MSTGEKERKVIHRAVRVLDEIETRIHELREELEANGMTSSRGRKARPAAEHDEDEGHEPQARGRRGKAEPDAAGDELHGAAKAAHDAKSGGNGAKAEHHEADDDREAHGQGRVKHPETDKRLKGNHGAGDELHGAAKEAHESKAGGAGARAEHDGGDDDREPHGQGRVKHPETDKRVKATKD